MPDISEPTPAPSQLPIQVLLAISQAIASVQNRTDLLRVICDRIQPVLPFDDAGIAVLNETGDAYYEFLTTESLPSEVNQRFTALSYDTRWMPVDDPIRKGFEAELPLLMDIANEARQHPNTLYLPVFQQAGLRQLITRGLRVRGKTIGIINLNSQRPDQYSPADFSLFNGIADLVGVAVSNILTNEEILEQEREKTLLLEISGSISLIRDKVDLLQAINDKLQPIFKFDATGLFIINETENYHYDLTVAYPEIDGSATNRVLSEALTHNRIPHEGTAIAVVYAELTEKQKPVIFDFEDLLSNYPHPFADLILSSGFKETIAALLRVRGIPFGIFFFNSRKISLFKEKDFRLFQAIADQIAVAVANILANEEILEREQEKSQLLEISAAIAQVQNASQLLRIIELQIKPVFPFDTAGLFVFDDTGENLWEILDTDGSPDAPKLPGGRAKLIGPYPYQGYHPNVWLYAEKPAIYAIAAQRVLFPEGSHERAVFDRNLVNGLQQMIGGPFYCGGRKIGVLSFNTKQADFYSASHLPLFKALADQIAVAVANIQAMDEILAREREKSQLLEISEAIAQVQHSKQLLRIIYEKIKPVFPYDNAGLYVFDQTGEHYRSLLDAEVLPDEIQTQLEQENLLGLYAYKGHHPDLWGYAETAAIYSRPAQGLLFAAGSKERASNDIIVANGLRQMIGGPLYCGGRKIGLLCFNTKQADFYSASHLPLFKALADQIAVAVANILANEAIERQLREITTLKKRIEAENVYLQEEVKSLHNFEEIIGTSAALHDCLIKVGMVARTPSTVLIGGETGTGKELIARAIHNLSERRAKPLIKINCAALPRELIESELFGHERGAFTGAIEKRIGKFELANGSTLFLDEVGELPLEVQAKLLRAIQEREIERLGGNRVITVDVRIIVATNRDLQREVQAGRFRADLFFRLNVFPITLPPLRERRDDIPLLTAYFVQKSAKKVGKVLNGVSTKAMQALLRYHFPGNIRELEHIIERGAILATGRTLHDLYLPTTLAATAPATTEILTLADQERSYILSVLDQCRGRVSGPDGAARLLGVPSSTLESKMKKLGITKKHHAGEERFTGY